MSKERSPKPEKGARVFLSALALSGALGGCGPVEKPQPPETPLPSPSPVVKENPTPTPSFVKDIVTPSPTLTPTPTETPTPLPTLTLTPTPTPFPTETSTSTPEPTVTAVKEELYEKDFRHIIDENGREIPFGIEKISLENGREEVTISGVILSEPYEATLPIVDSKGNQVYEYNCWAVDFGFPLPNDLSGKLQLRQLYVWEDSILPGVGLLTAKDGVLERVQNWYTCRDKKEFFDLLAEGTPIRAILTFNIGENEWKEIESMLTEEFPGQDLLQRRIYLFRVVQGRDNERKVGKEVIDFADFLELRKGGAGLREGILIGIGMQAVLPVY